jgi:membrane protease YdiL (CAAX protease family)
VARLDRADLGLTRSGATRSAWIGLLTAGAMVVPALLILRFPPLVGRPVAYTPLAGLPWVELLGRALVSMPLDTILPEEVAFRGALLGVLRRRYPAAQAVVLAAVPFALWHGVLVGRTLELTNLAADPLLFSLGLLGAFAAVFLGGILFGILRLATGHLAGSIVAHWGFNAALLFGLWGF